MPFKAAAVWLIFTLTILQSKPTFCQKGNFRPYNPIQNIFDSFFHGPPPPPNNRGPVLVNQRRPQSQHSQPPVQQPQPQSQQQQQQKQQSPSNGGSGNNPPGGGPPPILGAPNKNANGNSNQVGPQLGSTLTAPGNGRLGSDSPSKSDPQLPPGILGQTRQQPQQQQQPSPGRRSKPPPLHAPRKPPLPVLGLRQRPQNGRGVPRHHHRPNLPLNHPGIHPLNGAFIGGNPQRHKHQEFNSPHTQQHILLAPPPGLDLVTPPSNVALSSSLETTTSGTSVSSLGSETDFDDEEETVTIIDELKRDVPSLAPPTDSPLSNPSGSSFTTFSGDIGVTKEPGTITFINDNPFEAPQIDFPDVGGNGVESGSEEVQRNFLVKPRGHSSPVFLNKIPVAAFKSSLKSQDFTSTDETDVHEEEEKDEFYFVNANANQHNHKTAYPSHKQPRYIKDFHTAESSHHYSNLNHLHEPSSHEDHGELNPTHDDSYEIGDDDDLEALGSSLLNTLDLTERVDQVRELVDCGGSDLGFCDMSSKYPGHMMGNLMSECQQLVYRGFVPVPEDLEELGDSNPVAKYSNASKSSVRAQTGSWSWKPYTYKKKQVCDSELRFIRPGYAKDATGKWQVIVQTEALPQRVAIDLCHAPLKPCHLMSDCGRKSRCVQRYNFQHLLAVDPDNLHHCPTIRAFKFPSSCVCHIELADYHDGF